MRVGRRWERSLGFVFGLVSVPLALAPTRASAGPELAHGAQEVQEARQLQEESVDAWDAPPMQIVGGTEVTDRSTPEFRHTVRLLVTGTLASTSDVPADIRGKPVSWRCSGTIVSTRALVTAAHCVPSKIYLPFSDGAFGWVALVSLKGEVFYRESSRTDVAWGAPTTRVVRHPSYKDDWMIKIADAWNPTAPVGDIAVVFLRDAVPAFKDPVTFSNSVTSLVPGTRLTLAGFGRSGGDNPYEVPLLRKVEVPFRAALRNGTDAYLGEGDIVRPRKVGLPKGACGGDSGGPVYVRNGNAVTLGGVIVRGPGNDNGGCLASVSIMTDLRAYAAWLRSTLAQGQ